MSNTDAIDCHILDAVRPVVERKPRAGGGYDQLCQWLIAPMNLPDASAGFVV
mgnify:CR=1